MNEAALTVTDADVLYWLGGTCLFLAGYIARDLLGRMRRLEAALLEIMDGLGEGRPSKEIARRVREVFRNSKR